jgi:hypothetical protein
MKICSKCNIEKQFDNFGRCSKIKDGYRSECKLCRKTDSAIYYKNNNNLTNKSS